jgi:hypothetical protein
MPTHFSTIGFFVASTDDFMALAKRIAPVAQEISVPGGSYLHWRGADGEELWLQKDRRNHFIGMDPHFSGRAVMRAHLKSWVKKEQDGSLDGSLSAWANPARSDSDYGEYPFIIDVPDASRHFALKLPCVAKLQIAAFAHEITYYSSVKVYEDEAIEAMGLASQAFIPSGMFSPDGTHTNPPEAFAILSGHVLEAAELRNGQTGNPYYWALIEGLGGCFDIVIDHELLPTVPEPRGVLKGSFWLSGRIVDKAQGKKTWWQMLSGK